MKRSKSNSVGSAPSRPDYLSNYESTPVWPQYRRMDSSPPPPYTSQETSSRSSSLIPTVPSDRSQRRGPEAKAPTTSEYTPLLEDFTRKFVESQLSIPTNQQVHSSTSQLVPPELLLLCQQQAPFNPNFDSLSTSSTNSLLTLSDSQSRHNSISHSVPKVCGIFSRSRCNHIRWFLGNFILLTSLMSFNWGMLVSPQIYSKFFLVFMKNTNSTSSAEHQANSIAIDLLIAGCVQFVLMLIALMSGLILLYAATRVVATVRKRFHASMKYRIHISNQTPFPWFFITYERIAFETLGAFFARLLSLILTLYLFGVSAIYVLLLSDYLNMFFSLLNIDQVSQLFCQNSPWYLSHDVVVTIWLTFVLLLIFGLNSFRRRDKYSSSLWYLKKLAVLVGFFSVIYLIFVIIFAHLSSNQSSQANLVKAKRIYTSNLRKLACLKSDSSFDWGCVNKNWSLLFLSVPLLITPFHLNELLITLLFASQQQQDSLNKSLYTSRNALSNQPTDAAENNRANRSEHRLSDYYASNGAPLHDLQQRIEQEATRWEQLQTRAILDDTVNVDAMSQFNAPESVRNVPGLSNLFRKPVLSFGSVRNMFVLVTFTVCLLNIIANVLVYITTFNALNTTNGFHMIRNGSTTRQQTRSSHKTVDILSLDLNFLNSYLHLLEPESSAQANQPWHRYLLIAASLFLLLKTTLTYLLVAFRGLLAQQTLTSSTKQDHVLMGNQAGICLNSFLFTSPFVLWNCFVLLFALFVEHSVTLLQYVLLLVCWLGCFLVFIYPAMILLYFSFQSMSKKSLTFTSSYTLLSVSFRPLRWPKSSLLLGLFLLSLGLFYLVFWLYAYLQRHSPTLMSILPLVVHSNTTSLYCSVSS